MEMIRIKKGFFGVLMLIVLVLVVRSASAEEEHHPAKDIQAELPSIQHRVVREVLKRQKPEKKKIRVGIEKYG